jgi:FkbM family methyltransferase
MKSPFWPNDIYSLGYWLRKYARYPNWLPLCNYIEHGVSTLDLICAHEKENDAPLIFMFCPRLVEIYKSVSAKPAYCLLNPFVFCRIANRIEQDKEAKGTLFYVSHSIGGIEDLSDFDTLLAYLAEVPEQFRPIDICLHANDVAKGLHSTFLDKGYTVYAGRPCSYEFAQDFYRLLANFRYTMSNAVGSYSFYAVEMGIPFSLQGEEPRYRDNGCTEPDAFRACTERSKQPHYKKGVSLFQGFHERVTEEQAEYVDYSLGKDHTVSRARACLLLYKALVQYCLAHPTYSLAIGREAFMESVLMRLIRLVLFLLKKIVLRNKDAEYVLWKKQYVPLLDIFRIKYSQKRKPISTLLGRTVHGADAFWYLKALKATFVGETYKFESNRPDPRILDCRADIGLSVIYFKQLFPDAKIVAFEQDPMNYEALKKNLRSFGYDEVIVMNKAAWKEDGFQEFTAQSYLHGRLVDRLGRIVDHQITRTPTVRLRDYLGESVEVLKMEIQGAETDVLEDCADLLPNVQNLFLEYHCDESQQQKLDEILAMLRTAGFKFRVTDSLTQGGQVSPRDAHITSYESHLHIFAGRA